MNSSSLNNRFKFPLKTKVAQNEICSSQKHKNDNDVLNPWQMIPMSKTVVFCGKPSRRHGTHRMIKRIKKRHSRYSIKKKSLQSYI